MIEPTREQRLLYARHLIACADTVSLSRQEDVDSCKLRALAGEFDIDIRLYQVLATSIAGNHGQFPSGDIDLVASDIYWSFSERLECFGLTSLAMVCVLFAVEQEFDIQLSNDTVESLKTVGDIFLAVRVAVAVKAVPA